MRTNPMAIAGVLALAMAAPALFGQAETKPAVRELIGVLGQPDGTQHDKARACQQLGEFGTREAVPALAALLADPALGAYARSGLEGIPDPSAAAALRAALNTMKGNALIGVVNSLGVLRDAQAVAALSRLAQDAGSGASQAALLALGRIANGEAIGVLRGVISSGPEALRPHAAAGCLMAAEFQLTAHSAATAAALYDAVRAASVPEPYRAAATRGAILTRKAAGIDLLVRLLRSDDRETRNIALYAARGLSVPGLGGALRAECRTAKPEVQAQLLIALADCCRDAESKALIRAKAGSENGAVREAAFKALGKTGSHADAAILVQAVAERRSADESAAAAESLARLPGAEVDALILKTLAAAAKPVSRVALIDLIDSRPPAPAATPELLKQAGHANLEVSLAALRTLRSLAGLKELPALVALTRTYKDGSQRAAAESALYYASTRDGSSGAGDLLLKELGNAREDLDRASWIRTLASLGYAKALPAILANVSSPNAWLAGTTIDSLKGWPTPEPFDELLKFAKGAVNADLHARALTSAVALAAAAAEKRQAPNTDLLARFERAAEAVRTAEDKQRIVSALDRWRATYNRASETPDQAFAGRIGSLRGALAARKLPGR
jgi:HEAT repeat protein